MHCERAKIKRVLRFLSVMCLRGRDDQAGVTFLLIIYLNWNVLNSLFEIYLYIDIFGSIVLTHSCIFRLSQFYDTKKLIPGWHWNIEITMVWYDWLSPMDGVAWNRQTNMLEICTWVRAHAISAVPWLTTKHGREGGGNMQSSQSKKWLWYHKMKHSTRTPEWWRYWKAGASTAEIIAILMIV